MSHRPEVHIVDLVSEMTTVAESDVLSPQLIQRIVQMAVRVMSEQMAHADRVADERNASKGARDMLDRRA